MAPTSQNQQATDTTKKPQPSKTRAIRFGIKDRTIRRGSETSPVDQRQHPPRHNTQASQLASTTWHTVEFSRNRRASSRAFSGPRRRLCSSILPDVFRRSVGPRTLEPAVRTGLPTRPEDAEGVRSSWGGHPPGPATECDLGVRSSLPGDDENITQTPRRSPNPCAVTGVTACDLHFPAVPAMAGTTSRPRSGR
jgi:hypothetical protein